MSDDKNKLSTTNQIKFREDSSNLPSITPPGNKVIERKVHIKVVEEVSDYDFPQAKRAWQALEDAGIEPGRLVANALEEGHNYKSNEMLITQSFKEKTEENLVGESAIEENRLVGYSYIDSRELKLLKTNQKGQALEIILQSNQLVVANQEPQGVKMTAVFRQKQPDLINTSSPKLTDKKAE